MLPTLSVCLVLHSFESFDRIQSLQRVQLTRSALFSNLLSAYPCSEHRLHTSLGQALCSPVCVTRKILVLLSKLFNAEVAKWTAKLEIPKGWDVWESQVAQSTGRGIPTTEKMTSALHGAGHVEKLQQLKTGVLMKRVSVFTFRCSNSYLPGCLWPIRQETFRHCLRRRLVAAINTALLIRLGNRGVTGSSSPLQQQRKIPSLKHLGSF